MSTDYICMNYNNMSTDQVGERLFRGRVFQRPIVGIRLKNITDGGMTISSILENFPHICSVSVVEGVSVDVIGCIKTMKRIIELDIPDSLYFQLKEIPPHTSMLGINLTKKNSADRLSGHLRKLLRKHTDHVVVSLNDYSLIEGDLFTLIGDLKISIVFHKT